MIDDRGGGIRWRRGNLERRVFGYLTRRFRHLRGIAGRYACRNLLRWNFGRITWRDLGIPVICYRLIGYSSLQNAPPSCCSRVFYTDTITRYTACKQRRSGSCRGVKFMQRSRSVSPSRCRRGQGAFTLRFGFDDHPQYPAHGRQALLRVVTDSIISGRVTIRYQIYHSNPQKNLDALGPLTRSVRRGRTRVRHISGPGTLARRTA
jgi:hypothetical protein